MEIRDLYDSCKNLTGKTFVKGEQVPKGYFYLIVAIFIENSNGEFLIQKRVLNKGGKWATTAGHPKSLETSYQGLLVEVEEELGINISNDKVYLCETYTQNDQFFDIYYLKKDIDIKDIVLQKEEVDDCKYASIEEIHDLYKKGLFHDNHYQLFMKCLNYLERKNESLS